MKASYKKHADMLTAELRLYTSDKSVVLWKYICTEYDYVRKYQSCVLCLIQLNTFAAVPVSKSSKGDARILPTALDRGMPTDRSDIRTLAATSSRTLPRSRQFLVQFCSPYFTQQDLLESAGGFISAEFWPLSIAHGF